MKIRGVINNIDFKNFKDKRWATITLDSEDGGKKFIDYWKEEDVNRLDELKAGMTVETFANLRGSKVELAIPNAVIPEFSAPPPPPSAPVDDDIPF